MRTKLFVMLVVVLVISFVVVVPASATPPSNASGEFKLLGENTDGSVTFEAHGTFEGIMTMTFLPGRSTRTVCDPCEVDDRTGTVEFNVVLMNYKHERGNWNSLSATGELAGLHFQGRHERPLDSPDGIYYGKIHFDPQ